jgi:hypothetical protein
MEYEGNYYKASAIVDQFLIDNDLTDHYFRKFLSKMLWGLREFKLKDFQEVKTCWLQVNDRKTAILPRDFVDWTKIGVRRGQYVITMGINEQLVTAPRHADDLTVRGLLTQHLPNGTDLSPYGGYYFFNFNGTTIFGISGGLPSKGYFKVVDTGNCKEILLDYDYGYDKVYVEYISDGFNPCGDTILHPYLCDYCLKYIEAFYEEKMNPNRTESSIRRKLVDVADARRNALSCFNQIDPQTFLNISRANARLTTKL